MAAVSGNGCCPTDQTVFFHRWDPEEGPREQARVSVLVLEKARRVFGNGV